MQPQLPKRIQSDSELTNLLNSFSDYRTLEKARGVLWIDEFMKLEESGGLSGLDNYHRFVGLALSALARHERYAKDYAQWSEDKQLRAVVIIGAALYAIDPYWMRWV